VELLLIALILLVVVVFVTAPLRRASRGVREVEDPRVAELEARKEAKYREIRDAEMDREAGKLSEREWRRQDAELRREAIAILKQLDALEAARRMDNE
jgi:predicted Holliday junction resolvase-like endonuclease